MIIFLESCYYNMLQQFNLDLKILISATMPSKFATMGLPQIGPFFIESTGSLAIHRRRYE